ncbi:hypothetical protein QE438_002491 [Pseudoxanthomonas sp. SORGH_AS 997]|nr:hypothetical protein [Pseudoxanthomonas sp. SORGH_AS_0997]
MNSTPFVSADGIPFALEQSMNDAVGNAGAVARPILPRRWRTRLALLALGLAGAGAALAQVQVQGTLQADQPGPQVSRNVFGQFAEHLGTGIYGGIWVGEDSKISNTRGYRNDVLAALRALEVPQLRWPGGCFADDYHWRDGIGPRKDRPVRINSNWGGVEEDNAFGLHEFMGLAELIGAAPYIAGNVGSAPPSEMAQWLEYMTATHGSLAAERAANGHPAPWTVPYFGIGNELWGCGGNMRPEYTVDVYRRYQTFLRPQPGQTLFRIAPGPNEDDTTLTETLMRGAGRYIDGLSLHYYTIPPSGWPPRASSTTFDEAGWIQTLSRALLMDDYLARHSAIMDKYDPQRRVALVVDEWGTWYAPLPGTNPGFLQQQNTLRDALVASVTLDVFTAHGRARAHGQHRPDGQRAAGDAAHRRAQDAAHAQLSRLHAVQALARCDRAAAEARDAGLSPRRAGGAGGAWLGGARRGRPPARGAEQSGPGPAGQGAHCPARRLRHARVGPGADRAGHHQRQYLCRTGYGAPGALRRGAPGRRGADGDPAAPCPGRA